MKVIYEVAVGSAVLFLMLATVVTGFPNVTPLVLKLLGASTVFVSIAVTRKLLQ